MEDGPDGAGWFARVDPGDLDAAERAITDGRADEPRDWAGIAVEAGFAATVEAYYEQLHEATVETARRAARERARSPDRQLRHAVRAMDDRARQLT